MDKKLLDSLNNLSVALESIADILKKKQTKSKRTSNVKKTRRK